MIQYVGSLSVGACIPGPVLAIGVALPDLQARITALANFSASVTPPSFSADLTLAQQIVANVQAAITAGIAPPSISAQLAAVAAILADLEAQLAIILGVTNLFASAGVHAYVYDGGAAALGGEFSAELSGGFPGGTGGSQHCNALVLATTVGATWTAMGGVFKLTP